MVYKFKGTAIGIVVVAGPDAGKIKYCIDGTRPKNLDLFTKWSKKLHLPWYYVLADTLEPGEHTLILKTTEEKNPESKGNACRIRYFFVNE
jgi:sialidase-1